MRRYAVVAGMLATVLAVACAPDKTLGPQGQHVKLVSLTSANLFANPETTVEIKVIAVDAQWGDPMPGLSIQWRISEGVGARIIDSSSTTDANGVAVAHVQLGTALGLYTVQA